MKKILTAIGTPELNNCLKEIKDFEIISNDIQYQDGIFEILEEKDVDIIILSELLKGEKSLKQLIEEIKQKKENIKIILLLEKENEEKIKIAKEEKIEKIMFHHKVSIQEMIIFLKEMVTEKNLEEEIQNLKKLILESNIKNKNEINTKNKSIKNLKNKIITKYKIKEKVKGKNKIIVISGSHGTGKSLISTCMALELENEKKILLVDFDLVNQSINTILGKKIKLKENNKNSLSKYDKFKIKISKNLDYLCGKNIIKQNNEKDYQEINLFFDEIKNVYDVIIIDISSDENLDYTELILKKTDIILFLTEGNLLEIKKAIKLLNFYINEWHVKKNKINIIFNKYNKKSIDKKILKNIFIDFNILGKIDFKNNYSLMINKNMKNYFLYLKERKEHKKILNKIL